MQRIASMGTVESKRRPPPGATVESAQQHLGEVRTLASHVAQQVREKKAAIFAMRAKGASKAALRAEIARLKPFQAQLSHLQMCSERLEASVIGIQTHRLNRETMTVMKNLSRFGTMTEREMESAASTLDDLDVVATQHEELSHIVEQAGAAAACDEDDVDLFFELNDPAPPAPNVPSVPLTEPTPPPAAEPEAKQKIAL